MNLFICARIVRLKDSINSKHKILIFLFKNIDPLADYL